MAFRLVSPMKRSGSAKIYFVQRIPSDVKNRAAGLKLSVPIGTEHVALHITDKTTTVRLSLRTSDASTAKVRQAEVAAYFETVWQSLRSSKPVSLTHRQCVALSKELFTAWTAEDGRTLEIELQFDGTWKVIEDTFTPPDGWQAALDHLDSLTDIELIEPEALEPTFGPIIRTVLKSHGIREVDEGSHAMLLRAFRKALRDAFVVQKRQAGDDYTPAHEQERFPKLEGLEREEHRAAPSIDPASKVSLTALVDAWEVEAKAAGRARSTLEGYRGSFRKLGAFLKHDDASKITRADLIAFKNHRIGSGISLGTVRDADFGAFKSVFGHAVANGSLEVNPADGLKVVAPRATKTRPAGFTSEEASAILSKALRHKRAPNENPQTAAAKRWVPWLCAYTGARVGEIVQLRKEDVRRQGRLSVITITPDAGTVKDKEVREVVLHPHLMDQGFMDFVEASRPGYLFLKAGTADEIRGRWRATKNRLAEFAREVVTDERVKPNHGWRHGFTTRAREAGIADSTILAIGGWSPPNVGGTYGNVTLETQAAAFEKFPRFDVEGSVEGD